MSRPWSLSELTELDLRLRPNAEVEVPDAWEPDASMDHTEAVKKWMEQTHPSDPEAATFASSAVRGESWFRASIWMVSLLGGMGAAAGLLRYGGEQLINVSAYLGVLVGGQLLLLLVLLLSCLWLRTHRGIREELFLPKAIRDLPVPQSLSAWRWRLFTTFQISGVAFNIGVLAATLWKVVAFDLAFGWATTLQVEPQTVSSLIHLLAAPWGGAFAPTTGQIAQSRIVLLEGFSHLESSSTASWWPFLMMCIGVYGLLPRLILTGFGSFRLHQALHAPKFNSPEVEHLIQQLTRKPLSYTSGKEAPRTPSTGLALAALQPSGPLRMEVPEDLRETCSLDTLKEEVTSRYSLSLTEEEEGSGLLLFVEAWQPPLEETLRHLRTQREKLGAGKQLLILALGLPDQQGGFEAPDPKDVEIWSQKLSDLRDPNLGLLIWEERS